MAGPHLPPQPHQLLCPPHTQLSSPVGSSPRTSWHFMPLSLCKLCSLYLGYPVPLYCLTLTCPSSLNWNVTSSRKPSLIAYDRLGAFVMFSHGCLPLAPSSLCCNHLFADRSKLMETDIIFMVWKTYKDISFFKLMTYNQFQRNPSWFSHGA